MERRRSTGTMSSSAAESKDYIEGPYCYNGDHLYESVGVAAVIGISISVLIVLAVIGVGCKTAIANAAPDHVTNHVRQEQKLVEFKRKIAIKKRELALAEEKQAHLTSFTAEISAYTAIETCGATCNMSNGEPAYYGAAACPRRLAIGTWINIEGLGVFVCKDHTAQWVDGRFDVFFGYTQADHDRAIQFGSPVRLVTINNSL